MNRGLKRKEYSTRNLLRFKEDGIIRGDRDPFEAFFREPDGPLLSPAGLAAGTQPPAFTREGQQPLVAAFGAPDPGESVHGVAAIKELPDCSFRDRPKGTEGMLKLFLVHTEKGLPVILEKSVEGAVRETS